MTDLHFLYALCRWLPDGLFWIATTLTEWYLWGWTEWPWGFLILYCCFFLNIRYKGKANGDKLWGHAMALVFLSITFVPCYVVPLCAVCCFVTGAMLLGIILAADMIMVAILLAAGALSQ